MKDHQYFIIVRFDTEVDPAELKDRGREFIDQVQPIIESAFEYFFGAEGQIEIRWRHKGRFKQLH